MYYSIKCLIVLKTRNMAKSHTKSQWYHKINTVLEGKHKTRTHETLGQWRQSECIKEEEND
jgi:hypothetical protein